MLQVSLFNDDSISDVEILLKSDIRKCIGSLKCNNGETNCHRRGNLTRKTKKRSSGCGAEIARIVGWEDRSTKRKKI